MSAHIDDAPFISVIFNRITIFYSGKSYLKQDLRTETFALTIL